MKPFSLLLCVEKAGWRRGAAPIWRRATPLPRRPLHPAPWQRCDDGADSRSTIVAASPPAETRTTSKRESALAPPPFSNRQVDVGVDVDVDFGDDVGVDVRVVSVVFVVGVSVVNGVFTSALDWARAVVQQRRC